VADENDKRIRALVEYELAGENPTIWRKGCPGSTLSTQISHALLWD
jgi:hypothetical protein